VFVRRSNPFGLAERIVVALGFGAALVALANYAQTLGHRAISFGWYAYAPLSSSATPPFQPLSAPVHLAIWAGASVVWALASVALMKGFAFGRRVVLVVALACVLTALGQYLVTLGNADHQPGLQFLSSEQLARYRGTIDSGAKLLIWLGLAVVWTIGAVLLLRRSMPRVALARAETDAREPETPTPAGR
jgi:hypothetical protein